MKFLLCSLALATPALAATSYVLPGNSETGFWDLNQTNYNHTTTTAYPASGFTSTAWGGPIAASATSATFTRVSGGGYFIGSGSGLYGTTNPNTYAVGDLAPMPDLASLIFQVRTNNPGFSMGSVGGGFSSVLLYLNGGTTVIAPSHSLATAVLSTAADDSDFAWQWDLSSYGEITSYQILVEANAHNILYGNAPELTMISASDAFAQAVPEPSSALMGAAALALTFIRRRRA